MLFVNTFPRESKQGSLRTWLTYADPGSSVADLAKECGSDLIVMGARTASSIVTHLSPGTAPKVLAEAPCPVMILHHS